MKGFKKSSVEQNSIEEQEKDITMDETFEENEWDSVEEAVKLGYVMHKIGRKKQKANVELDWCGDSRSPHHVSGGLYYMNPYWWHRNDKKTSNKHKKKWKKRR